jgi:hypothetical protein
MSIDRNVVTNWAAVASNPQVQMPLISRLAVSLVVLLGVSAIPMAFAQTSNAQDQAQKHQQVREKQQQKFLREHSDASGRPRPDLWRQGMEHARQMPVAANIGARLIPPPINK